MLFLIPHREIRMQWSLQKGTEMSMSPCHSNSFEGVGRESEGRSSILALCCHGLGGCWHCSKLPSAIREASVWELEVQPRGHGPFLLHWDVWGYRALGVATCPSCSNGSFWGAMIWTLARGQAVQPLGLRTALAGWWVPRERLQLWRECCRVASCFFLPWF